MAHLVRHFFCLINRDDRPPITPAHTPRSDTGYGHAAEITPLPPLAGRPFAGRDQAVIEPPAPWRSRQGRYY